MGLHGNWVLHHFPDFPAPASALEGVFWAAQNADFLVHFWGVSGAENWVKMRFPYPVYKVAKAFPGASEGISGSAQCVEKTVF